MVDDHTLFRASLSRLLESESDFDIVAHCATVQEGLDVIKQNTIDIILLDFDLGQENATTFISQARNIGFTGRILIVTAGMRDSDSVDLLGLGVSGIFPKHNSPALLSDAIRKVARGESWLEQRTMTALVEAANQRGRRPRNDSLTDRERHVLRGVFEGLSNKEIATQLSISESSVKAALQQLFQKMGVRTRSQLVRVALEQKL